MNRRARRYTILFMLSALGLVYIAFISSLLDVLEEGARLAAQGFLLYGMLSCLALGVLYGEKSRGNDAERVLASSNVAAVTALRLFLLPYTAGSGLVLMANRLISGEDPWNPVGSSILLGADPLPWERGRLKADGATVSLNLCFEFPRNRGWMAPLGIDERYLPFMDGVAPTEGQLRAAVDWLTGEIERGAKVLVHCAQGHGRSAVVVAAYLLAAGKAVSPGDALAQLRSARPGVILHGEHMALLARFQREPSGEV